MYNIFWFLNMSKQMKSHEKISDLLASIGNPVRVRILLAIGTGEACVCHLESLLDLRQAYISQQLMLLRKKEIITARREGKYIYYRLIKPEVLEILREAGEIVGVPKDELVIQDHSNCECPKCNVEETIPR
jgi:DNA-binding transcriptional ArsR family regulator